MRRTRLALFSLTALILANPARAISTRTLFAPAGPAAEATLGQSVASAGDLNHDGFDDVIVGAPFINVAGVDPGRAYVYFGGPAADSIPDLTITGEAVDDAFGISVASAGDFNDDGEADVIVGAPGNDAGGADAGRAYIYFGGSGVDGVPDLILNGQGAGFGHWVARAGDVNGDGIDDVIVGAQTAGTGRAYVFFGGSPPNAVVDLTVSGEAGLTPNGFGNVVASAGDMNGDGFDDFAVGQFNMPGRAERAYVYFGGAVPDSIPDLAMTSEQRTDAFGRVASAGDVNGDGYADLIIGAQTNDGGGTDAGRAYIYLGGAVPDTFPDVILTGPIVGGKLGPVASAGDVNRDGYADVVAGAFIGAGAGAAYVYFGGPAPDSAPDLTFYGEASGDLFGLSVASAGDVNGDGFDDVVVGAQSNDAGGNRSGRAYVIAVYPYEVVSPNGGETWTAGQSVSVHWLGHDLADVSISFNNGASWSPLEAGVGGAEDNTISVTAPGTVTNNAKIRLTYAGQAATSSNSDASNATFAIVAPPFSLATSGLPAMGALVSSAWGDYDGDGDLDVLIAGFSASSTITTRIYRNDSGTFVDIGAGLTQVYGGTPPTSGWTSWVDFDNDGDLDPAFCGLDASTRRTLLYRNNGGTFAPVATSLPDVSGGSMAWGDYDRDGDPDLAIGGSAASGNICRIYRNDGGTFTDIGAGLPGIVAGALAWGDFDNDGDLDLALAGAGVRIYRNDAGSFVDIAAPLTGGLAGTLDWGDYDQDGDLDLLVAGAVGSGVFRNSGGTFANIGATISSGSGPRGAIWGDFDNDGDLDILSSGGGSTRIYRNDAGSFVDIAAPLPGLAGPGSLGTTVADYDNDGRLDFLLSAASLFHNDFPNANTPPASPSNLHATRSGSQATSGADASQATHIASGSQVTFSWDASSDAQTAAAGLSYSLRAGTTPGGSEIASALAAPNGHRLVVGAGNAQQRTSVTLTIPTGVYYWSVQAVDAAFAGSVFAAEQLLDEVTAVEGNPERPARFALSHAAPTPFQRTTTISYEVPRSADVRIVIFDLGGRRVRTLVSETRPAGRHTVGWDATDDAGRRVPAGVYLLRMQAGEFAAAHRVLLLPQ